MNDLTPEQLIAQLTATKPYLLVQILKLGKPYLSAIEERCQQVQHGTVSLTLTVRAGEVEKMELEERKTWLRPKLPVDARPVA